MTADRFKAYEDLRAYPLEEELRARLYAEQLECVVVWSTRDGWPVGVTHWFVWQEGRFWVTTTPQRKKVAALRARPQSSVIVSSIGTSLGPARTVTAKTMATVHDDKATKAWFHPALAARAFPGDEGRRTYFQEMLEGTERVVIELEPVQFITFDARRMWGAAGTEGV